MKPVNDQTLAQLAQQHGTPLWVYDAATIRARVAQLAQFDTVRFAQKANSNIHLLTLMREAGVHVDAVSLGEIERALQAGFAPAQTNGAAGVVFTCDLFDRATLARVMEAKIEVNCGSVDMLRQLGPVSPGHRVWLRINPGYGHGHSNKTNTGGENSKHGIWHEELQAALAVIREHKLHLVGLVKNMGHDIEAISTGGGLSVPYREGEQPVDTDHYFQLWDAARKQIEAHLGHPVHLEIEPGRFLVADAGLLVAEVRATKQMGGNHFTLLDTGFNELMRPAMYGSYHAMTVIAHDGRALDAQRATVVGGPLCESGDVFTQRDGGVVETRLLPAAQVGDYMVFEGAGAYGASMSSNYNSRPHAAEYLVDGADVANPSRIIRRRQTVAELIALEAL